MSFGCLSGGAASLVAAAPANDRVAAPAQRGTNNSMLSALSFPIAPTEVGTAVASRGNLKAKRRGPVGSGPVGPAQSGGSSSDTRLPAILQGAATGVAV